MSQKSSLTSTHPICLMSADGGHMKGAKVIAVAGSNLFMCGSNSRQLSVPQGGLHRTRTAPIETHAEDCCGPPNTPKVFWHSLSSKSERFRGRSSFVAFSLLGQTQNEDRIGSRGTGDFGSLQFGC